MKKKKKKRYKLRYEAIKFLVYFVFFLFLIIFSIKGAIKVSKEMAYQKTYNYKLSVVGYNEEEVDTIIDKTNDKIINFLLENEKDDIYYKIIAEKYYLNKNFDEYLEYYNTHQSLDITRLIAIVNVHANDGWYNNIKETDLSKGDLILVNKFYKLDNTYKRDDLKNISLQYSYNGNSASEVVIEQFAKMFKDAKEQINIHLMVNSSYRSYEDQDEIYKNYKHKGEEYADAYAARPGHSEHQTGLALDITSTTHPTVKAFKESEEYEWLKQNSYKYGFILRYPEGQEDITGYNTESWHFRYVGIDNAKKIYQEGITFDEYYAFYIEK